MKKFAKCSLSLIILITLILQLFSVSIPVTVAEEVENAVSEISGSTDYTEPIDLKQCLVPVDEVPGLIDYSIVEEKEYMRRAYEKETSLNEVVFQKTDGSFDVYTFAFPVKYELEDGTVADKNPELELNETLADGTYRFSTTAKNDVLLQCADVASDGVLYMSDKLNLSLRPKTIAEAEFGFAILQANAAEKLDIIESSSIPEGYTSVVSEIMGQSALSASEKFTVAAMYTLSEGNRMSVVPSYNGFQVSLDLTENRTQDVFYFELSSVGTTLVRQDDTYVLLNDDGMTVGILGDAILSDESGVVDVVPLNVAEIQEGEQYFGDSRSDGPYLVAEEYVKMVASTCSNGYISAPINYITYLSGNETRLSTAIAEINENSGTTVYDTEMNRILIADSANLSYYEKCVILATYTGDVTFNSFAAEVVFHSLALKGVLGNIDSMYDSALRADMQTNERYLSGFLGGYHSQYRSLVTLQQIYHGGY